MKKFYALALAAFALTASAQTLQGGYDLNPVKAKPVKMIRPATTLRAESAVKPTAAPAIADIEGAYIWNCYEMLSNSAGEQVGESVSSMIVKVVEGNDLELTFDYGTFKATFDPATGNISIPSDQLVPIDLDDEIQYYAYFQNVYWPDGVEEPEELEEPLVLTYVNGGYETDIDSFISIAALYEGEDEEYQLDGYFHFSMDNLFTLYVEDIPEGWTRLGSYLYQDYYVLGAFNLKPAQWLYEVTVIQNDENNDLYRIVNPYNSPSFPLLSYNEFPADGSIEIDMSDPDFITVCSPDGAGYGMVDMDFDNIYPANLEYYFEQKYPTADRATIIEAIEEEGERTTFADETLTISDCVFGITDEEIAGYSWNGSNPNIAILYFGDVQSGINNVVADNDNNINAPVVYYNLQGVQVADPRGGIFIRKQGNKASKVIIK